MAQPSMARSVVWLFAAFIAWIASTWASGESFNWYDQLSQVLSPLLPPVYRRVGLPEDIVPTGLPDTTAVVLNWSRFPNVLEISSLLCSPCLDGIIAEVFIWNNSPNSITLEDFASTGCPDTKLRTHNSAENLYFQARFMACSQVTTPFCFIQDDDYLVHAEVIQSLRARIRESTSPRSIHLLPSQEHLSTSLRTINVNDPYSAHTSFAWLGYGTILHRSEAVNFLALLHALDVSDAELKLADNYYTILSNRVAEIWFDQGLELGGGQPFTVGAEGHERNNRHIHRAAEYLALILGRDADAASRAQRLPYVSTSEPESDETSVARAACRHARCLLETNIPLLPTDLHDEDSGLRDILELEESRRDRLSNRTVQLYLEHSPSRAVDDRAETYFQSDGNAAAGEYIVLDYFDAMHARNWTSLRMVWLVDAATRHILEKSDLSVSGDGLPWTAVEHSFGCRETLGPTSVSVNVTTSLWKCLFEWTPVSPRSKDNALSPGTRRVRVLLGESQPETWRVYETYLTGRQ